MARESFILTEKHLTPVGLALLGGLRCAAGRLAGRRGRRLPVRRRAGHGDAREPVQQRILESKSYRHPGLYLYLVRDWVRLYVDVESGLGSVPTGLRHRAFLGVAGSGRSCGASRSASRGAGGAGGAAGGRVGGGGAGRRGGGRGRRGRARGGRSGLPGGSRPTIRLDHVNVCLLLNRRVSG